MAAYKKCHVPGPLGRTIVPTGRLTRHTARKASALTTYANWSLHSDRIDAQLRRALPLVGEWTDDDNRPLAG